MIYIILFYILHFPFIVSSFDKIHQNLLNRKFIKIQNFKIRVLGNNFANKISRQSLEERWDVAFAQVCDVAFLERSYAYTHVMCVSACGTGPHIISEALGRPVVPVSVCRPGVGVRFIFIAKVSFSREVCEKCVRAHARAHSRINNVAALNSYPRSPVGAHK